MITAIRFSSISGTDIRYFFFQRHVRTAPGPARTNGWVLAPKSAACNWALTAASAEDKNAWIYTSTLPNKFMSQCIKHKDSSTALLLGHTSCWPVNQIQWRKLNKRDQEYAQADTYIHIYIHTYIHIYIHTHTHTYIHTYIHNYIPNRSCIHVVFISTLQSMRITISVFGMCPVY